MDLKKEGDDAFRSKDFGLAIEKYTAAIEQDGDNHVLYSNRAACFINQGDYQRAISDGNKVIELRPDWPKGYLRKATALAQSGDSMSAMDTYEAGLEKCPGDKALEEGSVQLRNSASQAGLGFLGDLFAGDGIWQVVNQDPELQQHAQDPAFRQAISQIQQNPSSLQSYMGDPRVMKLLNAVLQQQLGGAMGGAGAGAQPSPFSPAAAAPAAAAGAEPAPAAPKAAEPAKKPEAEAAAEPELTADQKEALAQKELGNAAYKKKDLEAALQHYDNAIALDGSNITFYTNKASVLMAQGLWEEAVAACEEGIAVGREHHADYRLIAKAYVRIGNAYRKQKRYQEAIDTYETSLLEHRNRETEKLLRQCQQLKRQEDELAYRDPELALAAKELGNQCFRDGKWREAIEAYSDGLRRDTGDLAPVLLQNRAAAFAKLAAFDKALEDCEACLQLDPSNKKAMLKQLNIWTFQRQFHKALPGYRRARELFPDDGNIEREYQDCYQKMMYAPQTRAQREERLARAMQDPQIKAIMADSTMRNVLASLQQSPDQLQAFLRDPSIADNLECLMMAGILSFGEVEEE